VGCALALAPGSPLNAAFPFTTQFGIMENPNLATDTAIAPEATTPEAKPSYVKLAMRNMVRKRGKSLQHFALTTIALLSLLIGLSYLTR